MVHRLEGFFQDLADSYMDGNLDRMVRAYSYPLALFIAGEIVVENSPHETKAAILKRREHVRRLGTVKIITQVIEVGDPELERFPVRVDWVFLDASGQAIGSTEMRYYCAMHPVDGPNIQIIEFLRHPFSLAAEEAVVQLH